MRKILLTVLLISNFNLYSATNEEGKWYKFTENYINNCVESINKAKERNNQKENNGISVSAIMNEIDKDCLKSSQAYNDTDSQISQHKISDNMKSCPSKVESKYIIPVGTHNQKIRIISKNKESMREYICNNGTWNIQGSENFIEDKVYCPESCLSWNNGILSECNLETVMGKVDSCGTIFPKSLSGSVLTLKAISDFKEGYAKVKCNSEGQWKLEDYTCNSDTCIANEVVTWNDKESKEYYSENKEGDSHNNENGSNNDNSGSEDLIIKDREDREGSIIGSQSYNVESNIKYLKNKLSLATAQGHEIKYIIKELENLMNKKNKLRSQSLSKSTYENNEHYQGSESDVELSRFYECRGKVITSDYKYGYVKYITEDNRIFKTEQEGLINHNIIEGSANLVCNNGKWEFKESSLTCKRKESGVNCANLINLGKKEGKRVNGYMCKNN